MAVCNTYLSGAVAPTRRGGEQCYPPGEARECGGRTYYEVHQRKPCRDVLPRRALRDREGRGWLERACLCGSSPEDPWKAGWRASQKVMSLRREAQLRDEPLSEKGWETVLRYEAFACQVPGVGALV